MPSLIPSQNQILETKSLDEASSTILVSIRTNRLKIPPIMVLENHTAKKCPQSGSTPWPSPLPSLWSYPPQFRLQQHYQPSLFGAPPRAHYAAQPNASSPNWLVNSGASHHLTIALMTSLLGMVLVLRLLIWVLQNYPLYLNHFYFLMSFVFLILRKFNFYFTVL